MSQSLLEKTCTPCRGGVLPLAPEAAREFQARTPKWTLLDDDTRIERTYRFSNFREAFDFVHGVADLAEAQGHHPEVSFGWGRATISLQTKKIKGLHENDFIMAAQFDRLASERGARG